MDKQRKIAGFVIIIFIILVVIIIDLAVNMRWEEDRQKQYENKLFNRDVSIEFVNYTINDTFYENAFNYSFADDGGILIEFNISNSGRTYDGHFEVRSFRESRNITIQHTGGAVDEYELSYWQSGIDIEKVIIWSTTKTEQHSYLFSDLVYNDRYMIKIRFVCEYGIIDFPSLYNVTRS